MVENTFALLKGTFRELQSKTQFHVAFIPDVITCCALLHNMLLKQSEQDIAHLQYILQTEGIVREDNGEEEINSQRSDDVVAGVQFEAASQKRQDLGAFLSLQRIMPM